MITKKAIFYILFLFCVSSIHATTEDEMHLLCTWKSGAIVSEKAIQKFGIEKCFAIESINNLVFARMQGKSFKNDGLIQRSNLRYLRVLHVDEKGKIHLGEMVCHHSIANDLIDIFRQLFDARYPIERMVLIDEYHADDEASMRANNSSCFNYRQVKGSGKLSKHAQGLAVDINPLYNPCVKHSANGKMIVQPSTATKYVNRSTKYPYKIVKGDLLYQLFIQHGFKWGGAWRSLKDYQHFEK